MADEHIEQIEFSADFAKLRAQLEEIRAEATKPITIPVGTSRQSGAPVSTTPQSQDIYFANATAAKRLAEENRAIVEASARAGTPLPPAAQAAINENIARSLGGFVNPPASASFNRQFPLPAQLSEGLKRGEDWAIREQNRLLLQQSADLAQSTGNRAALRDAQQQAAELGVSLVSRGSSTGLAEETLLRRQAVLGRAISGGAAPTPLGAYSVVPQQLKTEAEIAKYADRKATQLENREVLDNTRRINAQILDSKRDERQSAKERATSVRLVNDDYRDLQKRTTAEIARQERDANLFQRDIETGRAERLSAERESASGRRAARQRYGTPEPTPAELRQRLQAAPRGSAEEAAAIADVEGAQPPPQEPGTARGGGPGGRGGGRRGLYGLIGRYSLIGFGLFEASRIAQEEQRRRESLALAGNDPLEQTKAELAFQTAVTGTPIIGPIAGVAAEYLGGAGRTGTLARLQAAKVTDDYTEALRQSADFRLKVSQESRIAAAPGELASDLEKIKVSRTRASSAAREEQRKLSQAANEQKRQQGIIEEQNVVDAKAAYAAAPITSLLPGGVSIAQRRADYFSAVAKRDAGPAAAFADARTLAAIQKLQTAATEKDLQVIEDIDTRDARYKEDRRRAELLRFTTANVRLGSDNQLGAAIGSIVDSTRIDIANPNIDARRKLEIFINGTSEIYKTLGETGRQLHDAGDDYRAQSRILDRELAGDPLGAQLEAIESQRQKAQRALPDARKIGGFAGAFVDRLIGGPDTRDALDEAARKQTKRVIQIGEFQTRALEDQTRVSALIAAGKPIAASALEIQQKALLEADQFKGDARKRAAVLQIGINEEAALERELKKAGRASEIYSGSFLPGAGEGNAPEENPAAAAAAARRARDDLERENRPEIGVWAPRPDDRTPEERGPIGIWAPLAAPFIGPPARIIKDVDYSRVPGSRAILPDLNAVMDGAMSKFQSVTEQPDKWREDYFRVPGSRAKIPDLESIMNRAMTTQPDAGAAPESTGGAEPDTKETLQSINQGIQDMRGFLNDIRSVITAS